MSVYDKDNFAGRVNYAASVIQRNGAATRAFDTCFEMYDGAAVAAALVRRSATNPKLEANLFKYIGHTEAMAAAAKYRGRNLAQVAGEIREARRLESEAWWREIDAKRAAGQPSGTPLDFPISEPTDGAA